MQTRYLMLLVTVVFMVTGTPSFADEFEQGRVTNINSKNLTIEIDGEVYECSRKLLRQVRQGQRVKFVVERTDFGDDRPMKQEVIEMQPR